MEKEIKDFVENNEILSKYLSYPKEELEIIRMYINLQLVYLNREDKDKPVKARTIRSCLNESYNYLDYMLSFRYKINTGAVSMEDTVERIKGLLLCNSCNCTSCIKKSTVELLEEVDKRNELSDIKISYLDVINFILSRKEKKYKKLPKKDFFKDVDLIDLMHVQVILEAELISISDVNEDRINAEYLDLTHKISSEYFINILYRFYKNKDMAKHLNIDINKKEAIFNEKDWVVRVYKIATFYKYLMEYEKVDILKALRRTFAT